ncbi:hypothetical protein [Streptomyces sp. NPDC047968]|uniref:hypothetical protein n=1 Tax=unclassified Streptomyces TaxID=2593676 RepID=UPI00342D60E0
MDTLCTACDHPTGPTGLHACPACLHRLEAWLAEIPRHLPLLSALLAPTPGPAGPGSTGRAHSPMPLRLDLIDLIGPGQPVAPLDAHGDQTGHPPVGAHLAGWARYIASTYPTAHRDAHGTVHVRAGGAEPHPRAGGGPAGWAAWLIAYLPYAAGHDWIGELYRQTEALVWRLRDKTDRRPRRTARTAPCPACEAFALVSTEGEPHIVCEACGHRLTHEEYRAHSAAVLPAITALATRIAARQAA